MRRIVVTEFLSLDGVMEDPGGAEDYVHGGWSFKFNDPEGTKFKLDETLASDAMLLGRVTYEGFAAAWPGMEDEVGFAAKMNSMPKYVVSGTLTNPTWNNTTMLNGELAEEVAKLKATEGGDVIVHGSRTLVRGLIEHDLVDQLNLMVFPVLLGSGKRLFSGEAGYPKTLSLSECKPLANGTLTLVYARAA
jgi:dihydrofolate reductase